MTSITPTVAAGYPSPLDRLQTELQSEVASGAISSADQGALSTALDSIDQSLQADRTNGGQVAGAPSPDQIKSKINDLIDSQVQNGTLTSAQATELQNVFANAFARGGPGGAGGHHGHHHHGGDAADSGGSSSSSSSSAADTLLSAINSNASDGTGTTSDGTISLIETFLQSLQNSQQQGAGYGANGDAAGSSSNALVVDFTS